VTILVKLVL